MNIAVLTLFPEMIAAVVAYGVIGRAVKSGKVNVRCFNPRDFTADRHRTVDDRPFGGGPGMVMMVEPLEKALKGALDWLAEIESASATDSNESSERKVKVVYLSPQGQSLDQGALKEFKNQNNLVLIAGRYEGIDERFINAYVDEEWSIGDYVLSGGELPAMVMIDGICRLLPGVLGDAESAAQDSFEEGLLDCPHYTRPEIYKGEGVPEVLMSGNHREIARWRMQQSLLRTAQRRPELLDGVELSDEQRYLLGPNINGVKRKR